MEKPKSTNEVLFNNISIVIELESRKSLLLPNMLNVFSESIDVLNNQIPKTFPHYTLHDINHSIRIMNYMFDIINPEQLIQINELELSLLFYCALLHDIGMALSKEDEILIKEDKYPESDIKYSAVLSKMNGNHTLALQEYVRRIHAKRSATYVKTLLKESLYLPNQKVINIVEEVALLCESHTEDFQWINKNLSKHSLKGNYDYNLQYCAFLLRLGDVLDFDSERTPPKLFDMIDPSGVSRDEWKQHFTIHNIKKITAPDEERVKKVVFHGKSDDASIHRKVLKYLSWVDYELKNSVEYSSQMQKQYNIKLKTHTDSHILTSGYSISDFRLKLDFNSISALLMGENIYGNKSLGLRELIQNSIDACKVRNEIENENKQFGDEQYLPKIKIVLDQAKDKVTIRDNGTGMSRKILENYFLNIGVSYYKSDDYLLKGLHYKPIGNFGIGFLACYMLSDKVEVKTRDYKGSKRYDIGLEKNSEFILFNEVEDVTFFGTEVILNYQNFIAAMGGIKEIDVFLSKYFLTDDVQIVLSIIQEEKEIEIKNKLNIEEEKSSGLLIPIGKYLDGIDGNVLIKRHNMFIKNLNNVTHKGTPYYFDGNELKKIEDIEEFKLSQIIYENEINFWEIPIIDSSIRAEFEKVNEVLEDFEDTIDKISKKINWISLFVHKDLQEDMDDVPIDSPTIANILPELPFMEICEISGHEIDCETYCYWTTINLFSKIPDNTYIPYQIDQGRFYAMYYKKKQELFMRNVLVNDFQFNLPSVALILDIDRIKVNLISSKFMTNISRNNIDSELSQKLNYSISKAVHLGARDFLTLSLEEKEALDNFIEMFFKEKSILEK